MFLGRASAGGEYLVVAFDIPTRFADKVNRVGGKVGLFAARSFTEGAWSAVSKARLQHEIVIGLLSDEDFRQFLDGEADALAIGEGSIIRTMLLL